ncbi:phosphate/phosphite/phosphonate ABC transporters, periplasmic binding protein [Budvicia aquatica]|uniref:Phosphate/phosphite/phosphonate ABC transporters, periplasmic binding protein n=1 Tax=Budvicia aquatica TaxID=82979 RepID=A0A484ZY52_9GAMM|nr:phosphate/phosphite/phosphonate ABC transporters, periplasmic binding protein [Budvicia aquatica]
MLVKADSPYKTMDDLKGKVVAHTSVSSNSGNLAPRALFPKIGITRMKTTKWFIPVSMTNQ